MGNLLNDCGSESGVLLQRTLCCFLLVFLTSIFGVTAPSHFSRRPRCRRMPQLKQLSCCIQWSDTNAPFQEHGTVYGDGVVEAFISVPNKPQGFCIRLTSRGFISEGLSMIVFIDGNYQCNRTRVNLCPPKKGLPTHRTEVDFLLRQKEKAHGDGMYMGREWRFDNHNIGKYDSW